MGNIWDVTIEIDREESYVENGKTLEPFHKASIQMINRTEL